MKGGSFTFGVIKPTSFYDAGGIVNLIINGGFSIDLMITHQFTMEEAKNLYAQHKDRDFFIPLCEYMCSGQVYLMRLWLPENDAVDKWRKLMGATDPQKSSAGTVRKIYGRTLRENAVHGSDSNESAERELKMFEKIVGK